MNADPGFQIDEVAVEAVRPMRQKHLRPDRPLEDVIYKCDDDPSARHFAVKDGDGSIVGVGTLNMEDRVAGREPFGRPGMRLRGVAVEDDWRGQGIGAALVARMVAFGLGAGVREAWGNARTVNLGFYVSTGFEEMSSEFEIPGIGTHVVIARDLAAKPKKPRKKKKAKDVEGESAEE